MDDFFLLSKPTGLQYNKDNSDIIDCFQIREAFIYPPHATIYLWPLHYLFAFLFLEKKTIRKWGKIKRNNLLIAQKWWKIRWEDWTRPWNETHKEIWIFEKDDKLYECCDILAPCTTLVLAASLSQQLSKEITWSRFEDRGGGEGVLILKLLTIKIYI